MSFFPRSELLTAELPEAELPRVSVILPVRNEARWIASCLDAVLAQDYPPAKLEILVADGASQDGTREFVSARARQDPRILLLDNPEHIVATGMNRALKQASGDVIVRVDGHTLIAPDYVRQCVLALTRTAAACVGGRMNAVGQGAVGRAVALATSSRFGVGGARFHYLEQAAWVDTVYLGAWRRDLFTRLGPFDEELVRNQDDELSYRIRAQGGQILLSPAIRSRYFCRATLGSLWRQYFQYGYFKVRVLQKHPRQMQPRQFIPPLFLLVLLTSLLSAPGSTTARFVLATISAAYTAANFGASLWTARRAWRTLPLLPPVFACLHFAYGTGFLWGLLRFARRFGERQVLL